MAEHSTDVELERAYDREDLASAVREVAVALADDHPLRIDDGNASAAVTVPSRLVGAFGLERDADADPPTTGLSIDLEWDDPDGSSVRLEDGGRETPGVVCEGPIEPATDPATAAMPPDAVVGRGDASERRDDRPGGESAVESESNEGAEGGSERTSRFEVYEDRAGEWRWRLVHWNGNIVADSGEGYASRSNARRAARSVMRTASTATIVNLED